MSDYREPNYDINVLHPNEDSDHPINRAARGLIRDRFLSMHLTESTERAPSLTLTLQNQDQILIDPRVSGDTFLEEGVRLVLRHGYFLTQSNGLQLVSNPMAFTIAKTRATPRHYIIEAIPEMSQLFGADMKPKVFDAAPISQIVRTMFELRGVDAEHRAIQDTINPVSGIRQEPGQTAQSFIARLAMDIGYVFYQSPHRDGKPIFHFHKPGAEIPKGPDVEIGETNPGAKYGEPRNGNIIPADGVIVFRIEDPHRHFQPKSPFPILSDVKDWEFEHDPTGSASSATAVGIDLVSGNLIDTTVKQSDVDTLSLSEKTLSARDRAVRERVAESLSVIQNPSDLELFMIAVDAHVNAGSQPEDEARNTAKAALENVQATITKGRITLVGTPLIQVGRIWKCFGFGKYDGDYFVREVTTDFSQGYTTTIGLSSEGVNTTATKDTGRARNRESVSLNVVDRENQKQFSVVSEGEP